MEDDDFIKKIKFYVVKFYQKGKSSKEIFSFHYYKTITRLMQGKLWYRMLDNRLHRIQDEILGFNKYPTLVFGENCFFILKQQYFSYLFNMPSIVAEVAKDALKEISKHLDISDLNDFIDSVGTDRRFALKIASLKGKPYLPKLTVNNIKKINSSYALGLKFVKENGIEKLDFANSNKIQIVKLLNDEFLKSELTDLKYEASNKNPL